MLVLALDTSTAAVSVALVDLDDGTAPVLELVEVDGRRTGELLAPLVQRALAVGRPDALAVGLGPGPFTGLRIGIVTAAALGDALGVPAYGGCSLDVLGEGPRVAVSDARRKEVYWAAYAEDGTRDGPHVTRPADLALPPGLPVLGPGAELYGLGPGAWPSAPRLARLVEPEVRAGAVPAPLTPLYLRAPDAVEPSARKTVLQP